MLKHVEATWHELDVSYERGASPGQLIRDAYQMVRGKIEETRADKLAFETGLREPRDR